MWHKMLMTNLNIEQMASHLINDITELRTKRVLLRLGI